MICSIIQPTFFPWSGYFNIIAKSDIVVFLDDAQFSKNSWHNRNQILVNKKKHLITVPLNKSSLHTKICLKTIDNSKNWKSKILDTINQNYKKSVFYENLLELLSFFSQNENIYLAEMNTKLIKFICNKMNIRKKFLLASSLKIEVSRTEKIIKILDLLKASKYLSPPGSEKYLLKDKFENKTNVELEFSNFKCAPYKQIGSDKFIDYLSIIDLIANVGWTGANTYVSK